MASSPLEARFLRPSIRLRFNYYVQLVAIKRGRMREANLKSRSARLRGGVKLVVNITVLSPRLITLAKRTCLVMGQDTLISAPYISNSFTERLRAYGCCFGET